MGFGGVEFRSGRIGRQVLCKRVLIGAVAAIGVSTCRRRFGRRLRVGDAAVGAGDIGLPFTRTPVRSRRELCDQKTDVAGRQTGQALVEIVGQRQLDRRRAAVRRHGDAGDDGVDPVGRGNRHAAGRPRWSRRPFRSRRALRPGRPRGAVVTFTTPEKDCGNCQQETWPGSPLAHSMFPDCPRSSCHRCTTDI